jgi:hypothetical protein
VAGQDITLSSDWTGLSKHLIATFYPVQQIPGSKDALAWERKPDTPEVRAPLTEGTIEQTANWTSPFENQTADAKLGTFSAMLQSGGFSPALQALAALFPKDSVGSGLVNGLNKTLDDLRGKTSITKLNSVQIFTGMPPMKVNVTAHFRALRDSKQEVELPLSQLVEWSLPKQLSNSGIATKVIEGAKSGLVESLYSGDAPQIIGMQFANMLFIPLVIESVSRPLTGPRDRYGYLTSAQVTLSLSTLTALDQSDWKKSILFNP